MRVAELYESWQKNFLNGEKSICNPHSHLPIQMPGDDVWKARPMWNISTFINFSEFQMPEHALGMRKCQYLTFANWYLNIFVFVLDQMAEAVATDCHGNYPNILRIVSFISLHKIIPILRNVARFVMVVGSDYRKQYCNCRCLLSSVITDNIRASQCTALAQYTETIIWSVYLLLVWEFVFDIWDVFLYFYGAYWCILVKQLKQMSVSAVWKF